MRAAEPLQPTWGQASCLRSSADRGWGNHGLIEGDFCRPVPPGEALCLRVYVAVLGVERPAMLLEVLSASL